MALGNGLVDEKAATPLVDREAAGDEDQRQDEDAAEESPCVHWPRRLGARTKSGKRGLATADAVVLRRRLFARHAPQPYRDAEQDDDDQVRDSKTDAELARGRDMNPRDPVAVGIAVDRAEEGDGAASRPEE